MKKNRYMFICSFMFLTVLLLSGCKKEAEAPKSGRSIYYVNMDKTGLVEAEYQPKSEIVGQEAERILEKMKKHSKDLDYQAAIPEKVNVQGIGEVINQDNVLVLNFSSEYMEMDHTTEVLMREAIVRTMIQIDGIDSVIFMVEQVPLKDKYGAELGKMDENSFLKDTGSALQSYKKVRIKLYFVDEEEELVQTQVKVPYNSNTSLEKLVLKQLMKGPSDSKLKATLPEDLKVLSVSEREGICYVNFDDTFLNASYSVAPKLVIQSIVNSIIDAGNVTKVQITVNGSSDVVFQGQIPLEQPFSRMADDAK